MDNVSVYVFIAIYKDYIGLEVRRARNYQSEAYLTFMSNDMEASDFES